MYGTREQQRYSIVKGVFFFSSMLRPTYVNFVATLTIVLLFLSQPVGAATIGQSIALLNSGFDDATGLSGLPGGDNSYDFINAYVGWSEYDLSGSPVVGTNVGPINVFGGDIAAQTTSGELALYQGNSAVRIDQTSTHVISAADTSITVGVDVGNDIVAGFGGYVISLYAEDGLGTKTTIKTISSSVDGGDPADNTYLAKTLTITPADYAAVLGQKIGVSLSGEGGPRDMFYDSVRLNFTTPGVSVGLLNPGFDDTTGLTDTLLGNNDYDFSTNPLVGWTKYDTTGGNAGNPSETGMPNNVGPINVHPVDIAAETTSGQLALYQGNSGVRIDQTTSHVISASDDTITVGVDVGNDVIGGFGGYVISLYADNGVGTKTTLKTLSTSVDGGGPGDNSYLTKTLTVNPADLAGFLGQRIGVSLSGEGGPRDLFYDSVTLGFTTQGTPISVLNPGFDDPTGLSGLPGGNNSFDFTNAYVGWTEYDTLGNPVEGTNVGPINVNPDDIAAEATSGELALYQGNVGVRIDQTTGHVISASDTSFRLLVDVGNDSIAGFGGYLISLYAEDGLGTKTILKTISSSIDGFDPADDAWLTMALTLDPSDFSGFFGQDLGISLGGEGGPRDLFYDSVSLTFTAGGAVLPGDVNFDGVVNIFDINLVSSNWGTPGGPTGDANGDGNVDIFDINLISSNWSPSPGGAAAVPEPASGLLLVFAGLGALLVVKRRRCSLQRSQS